MLLKGDCMMKQIKELIGVNREKRGDSIWYFIYADKTFRKVVIKDNVIDAGKRIEQAHYQEFHCYPELRITYYL